MSEKSVVYRRCDRCLREEPVDRRGIPAHASIFKPGMSVLHWPAFTARSPNGERDTRLDLCSECAASFTAWLNEGQDEGIREGRL